MEKLLIPIFISLVGILAQGTQGAAQELKSISFQELEKEIQAHDSGVLIVNYWATWCRPCVEELPDFDKIHREYVGKGAEVWLINLDFNSAVKAKVIPFLQRFNLDSKLFHLTDKDPNEWINRVEPDWGGSIPFTIIYASAKKIFHREGPMNFEELKEIIENQNKNK